MSDQIPSAGHNFSNSLNLDELDELALKIARWRSTKITKFDPIPKNIKQKIHLLANSGLYKNSELSKHTGFSPAQIGAIKNSFPKASKTATKKAKPHSEVTGPSQLELLQFDIVPTHTASRGQKTDSHFQTAMPSQQHLASTSQDANIFTNNIIIKKTDGMSLTIPANLSGDLTYKIIELLCSR